MYDLCYETIDDAHYAHTLSAFSLSIKRRRASGSGVIWGRKYWTRPGDEPSTHDISPLLASPPLLASQRA